MSPNLFTQRFAKLHLLRYIFMSASIIGSVAISSSSVCLAKKSLPSVLPTCSTAIGTITSISGNQLQITLQQDTPVVYAQYSNATQFLKEDVVDFSFLREGINAQIQSRGASEIAETVLLNPSEQPLGCQMFHPVSQATPHPTVTSPSSEPLVVNQGIVQQITDNTFTILPRTGQPKTFAWTTNTTFLQYTDFQSSQILSLGQSVLLIGPARNGVIMASRITVLPQVQKRGKRSCFHSRSNVACDLIALGLLAIVF